MSMLEDLNRAKRTLNAIIEPRFQPQKFRVGSYQYEQIKAKTKAAGFDAANGLPNPLATMIERIQLENWMEAEYPNGVCEVHQFDVVEVLEMEHGHAVDYCHKSYCGTLLSLLSNKF